MPHCLILAVNQIMKAFRDNTINSNILFYILFYYIFWYQLLLLPYINYKYNYRPTHFKDFLEIIIKLHFQEDIM